MRRTVSTRLALSPGVHKALKVKVAQEGSNIQETLTRLVVQYLVLEAPQKKEEKKVTYDVDYYGEAGKDVMRLLDGRKELARAEVAWPDEVGDEQEEQVRVYVELLEAFAAAVQAAGVDPLTLPVSWDQYGGSGLLVKARLALVQRETIDVYTGSGYCTISRPGMILHPDAEPGEPGHGDVSTGYTLAGEGADWEPREYDTLEALWAAEGEDVQRVE